MPTFAQLKSEYRNLYDSMSQTKFKGVTGPMVEEIILGKHAYDKVAEATGVPWWFVGIIHSLECNCDFKKHLHNGDPLTDRTKRVPKGRPASGKPPFTWHESAVDAIAMKKLDKIKDWSIERALYQLEAYNGWGYRNAKPAINSPYLWSGTNHYTKGKFIRDHVFSKTAVSKQIGAAILLKDLMDYEASLVPIPEKKPMDTDDHSWEDMAEALLRGLDKLLAVGEDIVIRNKKR